MRRNDAIRAGAVALVAGVCLVTACGRKTNGSANGERVNFKVKVQTVALSGISETIRTVGDVTARSTVVLTAKVPGRLERLAFEGAGGPVVEGSRVKAGQIVGIVDQAVYAARVRQAEAAVEAAKAQKEDAEREEKRATALFKEGSITQQMREKAETVRASAEAGLKQAAAVLELAKIDMDESSLKSPIDGVVTAKHVDEGNMLSPGMPVLTIQDMSSVKILFHLPERYLGQVKPGQTQATVESDVIGSTARTGTVSSVYPSVDPAVRAFKAEIVQDNVDGSLRPGMFVRIEAGVARRENVPVIPRAAVVRRDTEMFVFVIEGSKARQRNVAIGLADNDACEITSGVKEGDVIVTSGQQVIRDGDRVEILANGAK